jgi:hypothetical protein
LVIRRAGTSALLPAFSAHDDEVVSLACLAWESNMKVRSVFLGGAYLSAGSLIGALPVSAQDYPQTSTPAEHAQTQQLNEQGAAGTASPADADQYQDQQDQYQQQQQQYQVRQQRYQDRRAQYHAQRTQYVRDIRRYDVARYEWTDYPRVYVYRYEAPEMRRLYLLADPTHQLAQVPIEAPSGRFIGKVRNVQTAPDGRPLRVEVGLNRVVSVWVSPDHFRFDPNNRVLFTDLHRDDLWMMPGATVESGVYTP